MTTRNYSSLMIELGKVQNHADAVYEQTRDENVKLLADSVACLTHILQAILVQMK